jgi:hypothetical protein
MGFLVAGLAATACGGGGYGSVAAGMSAADASKEMSDWTTSRIEPFEGGYSATYYTNNTCILFKNEHVVAKDEATEQRQGIALGGAAIGAVTVCPAVCVPPGVTRQKECNTAAGMIAPRR